MNARESIDPTAARPLPGVEPAVPHAPVGEAAVAPAAEPGLAAPAAAPHDGSVATARPDPARQVCRNCGTVLVGMHCHQCGQSSVEPSRPLSELVKDGAGTIIQLDSKFLRSLLVLLTAPGQLSLAFKQGIIKPYTKPLQLIFLLMFLVSVTLALADIKLMQVRLTFTPDARVVRLDDGQVGGEGVTEQWLGVEHSIPQQKPPQSYLDSIDRELAQPNNWVQLRMLRAYRAIATQDPLQEGWLQAFPFIMLGISPIFALLLMLFFRGKRYLFVDHLVFSLHVHSFGVLLLLVPAAFTLFWPAGKEFNSDAFILGLYIAIAARRFYGSGWIGSVLKGASLAFIQYYLVYVPVALMVMVGILLTR